MEIKFIPSICSYCGTGCGVLFEVIDGKIVSTLPMKTHPVNEGKLCIKGWNLHEHVNSFMRLKQPLVKTFGRFIRPTGMSHSATADRLQASRRKSTDRTASAYWCRLKSPMKKTTWPKNLPGP